jgi:hypothetical protein
VPSAGHHRREEATSILIYDGEFAIENHPIHFDLIDRCAAKFIEARQTVSVARKEPALALVNHGEGAEAVVLQLEDPVRIVEGSANLAE